jgi:ethanolamine utilization protein EutQ (cupin superfamily)
MDLGHGIFKSSLSTDEWEPDPDVGGEIHVLCTGVGVEAGLSRYPGTPLEPIEYTLPERETLLVLEGEARIEIADVPTLELKTGDIASLPKGARTTWHVTGPYREFWVFG